jgi:hypothetical protein
MNSSEYFDNRRTFGKAVGPTGHKVGHKFYFPLRHLFFVHSDENSASSALNALDVYAESRVGLHVTRPSS